MKTALLGVPHTIQSADDGKGFYPSGPPEPGQYVVDTDEELHGSRYAPVPELCPYCTAPLTELRKGRRQCQMLRVAHVGVEVDADGDVFALSHRIPKSTHRVLKCRTCRQVFTLPRKAMRA